MWEASAQWGCVCPRAFSTFEDLSFGGLSGELKKRLGLGSAWKSDGLHFSKAGSREFGRRMAFVRLINEAEPLQKSLVETLWATLRCCSLRDLSLCNLC